MAKRVFFSFHYDDVATFRANVVRKHDMLKDTGTAGFFDSSIWETAKRQNPDSLKRLINQYLENTSVTCALIGTHTWSRPWVRYELLKSYDRGNLLFGVHINGVRDKNQQVFPNGQNPFDCLGLYISEDGKKRTYHVRDPGKEWIQYNEFTPSTPSYDRQHWGKGFTLSSWVPCFDWAMQDGYNNFANWVASAK